jgi:hypothetical protein
LYERATEASANSRANLPASSASPSGTAKASLKIEDLMTNLHPRNKGVVFNQNKDILVITKIRNSIISTP